MREACGVAREMALEVWGLGERTRGGLRAGRVVEAATLPVGSLAGGPLLRAGGAVLPHSAFGAAAV